MHFSWYSTETASRTSSEGHHETKNRMGCTHQVYQNKPCSLNASPRMISSSSDRSRSCITSRDSLSTAFALRNCSHSTSFTCKASTSRPSLNRLNTSMPSYVPEFCAVISYVVLFLRMLVSLSFSTILAPHRHVAVIFSAMVPPYRCVATRTNATAIAK